MRKANGSLLESEVKEAKAALRAAGTANKKELFDIAASAIGSSLTKRAQSQVWSLVFAEIRSRQQYAEQPRDTLGAAEGNY